LDDAVFDGKTISTLIAVLVGWLLAQLSGLLKDYWIRRRAKRCLVSLDWARSRHKSFRDLLAHGIDPLALKTALGNHRFGVTMREWEAEQGRMHSGIYLCPVCGVSNPSIPKLSNDIRNCAR
jgi:hypothetical protein